MLQQRRNYNRLFFSADSNVSKNQKTVANFLGPFKIRRKLQTLHWRIIMKLGSYQEHVNENYQGNTLRGTGVQVSFLHDKMVVSLTMSCSISKLLTINTRKTHCVYYPLSHDSHSALSCSTTKWTRQIFSWLVICTSQWKVVSTSMRRTVMVRYRPCRN